MTFPPQEHKIDGKASIPTARAGFRVRVDDDNGIVTVLRGAKRVDEPLPRGLTPGQPIDDWVMREALLRFARAYADGDEAAYPALVALLEQRPPDVRLDVDPVARRAVARARATCSCRGRPGRARPGRAPGWRSR